MRKFDKRIKDLEKDIGTEEGAEPFPLWIWRDDVLYKHGTSSPGETTTLEEAQGLTTGKRKPFCLFIGA